MQAKTPPSSLFDSRGRWQVVPANRIPLALPLGPLKERSLAPNPRLITICWSLRDCCWCGATEFNRHVNKVVRSEKLPEFEDKAGCAPPEEWGPGSHGAYHQPPMELSRCQNTGHAAWLETAGGQSFPDWTSQNASHSRCTASGSPGSVKSNPMSYE